MLIMNNEKITKSISIILPAKNEEAAIRQVLSELTQKFPDAEIIVIDDGSDDNTRMIAESFPVQLISKPYSMGNGAAIKAGARAATGDILVFMDADGQHKPDLIEELLVELGNGYDMVVGERSPKTHANFARFLANFSFNKFASLITRHRITDLTSGFRAVRGKKFKEFLHLLPNGFSYPTTITMAFLRAGYSISFLPIIVQKRLGNSHIKPIRDGIRFLLIIFRVAVLYSPLKIFVPVSSLLFLSGLGYYIYTYASDGRFTNMGVLLLLSSILIFLIGLLSEQITFLIYNQRN
jgi:glycosyltransferase involved in cell wall biosynthesis